MTQSSQASGLSAAGIVTGIERERERVLVGLDAKIASVLERLSPVHYWRLLGKGVST